MSTHIVLAIINRIVSEITIECQTNVDPDDKARPSVIKAGRFQADPVSSSIHINVTGGDPEDPKYRDGIVTLSEMDNVGYRMPAREIGGTEMWWRRGIIEIGCFFINEQYSEEKAAEYAYTVLERVQIAISDLYVGDLIGTDGERAVVIFNAGNTFFQSGGPPANYIWRGKVFWQVLTERSELTLPVWVESPG